MIVLIDRLCITKLTNYCLPWLLMCLFIAPSAYAQQVNEVTVAPSVRDYLNKYVPVVYLYTYTVVHDAISAKSFESIPGYVISCKRFLIWLTLAREITHNESGSVAIRTSCLPVQK